MPDQDFKNRAKNTAKISASAAVFLILSSLALTGELPALAETARFADATATWSDVPSFPAAAAASDEAAAVESGAEEISDSESGKASWYVHPRYRYEMMAASTVHKKGTKVKVTNLKNNKSVIVTIKDYGPDPIRHPDRVIDLNKVAFAKIASTRAGVIDVRVEFVASPDSMSKMIK